MGNCCNGTAISFVAGNDVLLMARVYEKTLAVGETDGHTDQAGEESVTGTQTVIDTPFDLTTCEGISVRCTNGYNDATLEWAIAQDESNCLAVSIPHTLTVGEWAVEITCKRNGYHVRSFEFTFRIVETNCEAQTTFEVVDGCQSASVRVALQIVPQAVVRGMNDYEQWKLVTTSEDKSLQYFLDNVINFQSRADQINAAEAQRVLKENERQGMETNRQEAEMQREANSQAAVSAANNAAAGAERVNASLSGTTLTVTNRSGVSMSVDAKGEPGGDGIGVPSGGTAGQVLSKKSATDYDTEWVNPPAAGVNSVNGKTGDVTLSASDVGALPDDTVIPDAVTEQTVSGWGFTKNKGTYSKPSGGIPKTDLAADVQTSLGKADTALQSFTESDPTVPSWAKQSTKPSYTAQEVGALPADTPLFSGDYNDLSNKPTIPDAQIQSDWNQSNSSAKDFIKNKPTIPVVPTNVSAFTNDAGYLTQHQDISGKADKSEMLVVDGTGADADKTTITLKSGLSAQVLKSHQDITGKQDKIDSSHKLSADLVDDTSATNKFVTASDKTTWNGKQEALVSGTNIKTINNESLLGGGNINVAAELPSNLAYISNDGGEGIVPDEYYFCDTAAATVTKTVLATDYVLPTGGSIKIKMIHDNTANDATLNVNNTGAKPLFYADKRASNDNSWKAGEIIEVYYDGISYYANNAESNWQGYKTIVQSTEDYTLTDLVWTDTGIRGLKTSSDFWLNSGDKLNFSYTASYGTIIQQKKSDGTYVGLFSINNIRTLTAFEFICQVGGYYRFHVNSIANIVITPSYTADKKESISNATNSLSKQILDIESGISRCEEFLIESSFYAKNTGKVWNQATSELVSISNNGSSYAAIIEVEGVTDIHFKRNRWTPASYCPTFFSTKNSDEFNAETMVGYVPVNIASSQDEFYASVPANAKVICISLKNSIVKSQNIFFRKYYNKEPAIKVKRTWVSIGDSITRLNNDNVYYGSESSVAGGTFKTIKGYQGYLQERIKFNGFTNLGVNGANSLTYPWDDITEADIYTIALGINDWGAGNAVGTISDYKEWASGDTVDNFAKGIARIVKKIRTLNAYADIVIMTPTKAITGYYADSSNSPSKFGQYTYLHEYADMLIEIANYEGFPVADIYHHGNYNDGNIQYWTYDKCHPNDRGSRKIANLLFPVMRYFSDEYYSKD